MARKKTRKRARKKKKIIRLRTFNLNIGVMIFAFILFYLIVVVVMYLSKERIQIFTVNQGSLVADSSYTGIILRDETVYRTNYSGNVYYYIQEGQKAGVGDLIYSIDESGRVAELLAQKSADGNQLSQDNLLYLKRMLMNYSVSYDPLNFSDIYDVKYTVQAALLEYSSMESIEELNQSLEEMGALFQMYHAPASGIISYYADGFEELSPEQLTKDSFDRENYEKTYFKAGDLVESGTSIYKTIDSDVWSVIIPISEEDVVALADRDSVRVTFRQNRFETVAQYSSFVSNDGTTMAKLTFDNYMNQFLRFVEIELDMNQAEGLKIPVTSLASKDFFVVPEDFLTKGGESQEDGFMVEVAGEEGVTSQFVEAMLYHKEDGKYYIDTNMEQIKAGSYLLKPESSERYLVGETQPLEGVYNINKGYAVFRKVEILERNEDYCIVSDESPYGLAVYDHIVLDSSTVHENDIIY